MLEQKELLSLMKVVAKADSNAPVSYSVGNEAKTVEYSAVNEVLRTELNELAGTYAKYRENKNTIFALIEETLDEVLPAKILAAYGAFAEVKTLAQGDKPVFTVKAGKLRARQFITHVGLAGVQEVFKLSKKRFEVPTSAIGGAAQIGLEEFLDGRVDFAELVEIVMAGMDELVYREIVKALQAGVAQLPTANKVSFAGFDEAQMDALLTVARAYGNPVIYCNHEFAVKILPDQAWVSNNMKDARWAAGYFTTYKGGVPVIVLPQSFEDNTNTTKVIDPEFAYIIPTGTNEKPVKVAVEGQTIVDEWKNRDQSREVQVYKKIGVAALMTPDICIYQDTTLAI